MSEGRVLPGSSDLAGYTCNGSWSQRPRLDGPGNRGAAGLTGSNELSMARIPDVPCEKLIDALKEFDRQVLPTRAWAKWEQNRAHLYAIQHNGRLYPVKKIISIATGLPVTKFGGGGEANGYIEKRCGHVFKIVPRPTGQNESLPAVVVS